MKRLLKISSAPRAATWKLRCFGFFKIPLLFWVKPSVVELSPERAVVKIRLFRRTRNHLRSMYFGALAIGADCAAGLLATELMRTQPQRLSLIFKSLKADFLKRAEDDVYFTCDQGRQISDLVTAAGRAPERVEAPVEVIATVPAKFGNEPVARFTLVMSLKQK